MLDVYTVPYIVIATLLLASILMLLFAFLLLFPQGADGGLGYTVQQVQAGGFVPPKFGLLGKTVMFLFCSIFGFSEVGPTTVLGRNRIPTSGIRIIAPFHAGPGDGAVVYWATLIPFFWYLIRTTEVRGWRGWIATLTGAIAVEEESERGRSAGFKATISALVNDSSDACLLIFPQGKIVEDEVVRRTDFEAGLIGLAQIVAKKKKAPVWIIPVGVHYKRDPKRATMLHKMLSRLGIKKFRNLFGRQNYGAVAVIGRPIAVTPQPAGTADLARGICLPADRNAALECYVTRLARIQKIACKH